MNTHTCDIDRLNLQIFKALLSLHVLAFKILLACIPYLIH